MLIYLLYQTPIKEENTGTVCTTLHCVKDTGGKESWLKQKAIFFF